MRYNELMQQLQAERDARAALEKQMDEAATQLAAANNRYQEALVLLHSERSKAATLEVSGCWSEGVGVGTSEAYSGGPWEGLGTSTAAVAALPRVECPGTAACMPQLCSPQPAIRAVALFSTVCSTCDVQRDASEAKSMLATANIRYAELTDRLDEEKKRAALLEVRAQELPCMACRAGRCKDDHTAACAG